MKHPHADILAAIGDNRKNDNQTIIRIFLEIKEDMRRIADSQAEISATLTNLLEKKS